MALAITMYISFLLLCRWVSPTWRRRFVGYGLVTDICVHVVLQGMFGGDAEGRAGLLLAGLLINMTMHAYKRLRGYERITETGWQRYNGNGEPIPPEKTEPLSS